MIAAAVAPDEVETVRPLLPVGYSAVAAAYQTAATAISVADLTTHYTTGTEFFRDEFVPCVKARLTELSGGAWDLADFDAVAAGSDVDLIAHIVEAVAPRHGVSVFPGDWFGFVVGSTHDAHIRWETSASGRLAAICVPSVRDGHLTDEMVAFLDSATACLLNINLFPTLPSAERSTIAQRVAPLLQKALISVSFSRGFGLTASQLGVLLVHRDHPYRHQFARQWNWFSYFYNALAARAFMAVPMETLQAVDAARREWAQNWLRERSLPVIATGSYYVKTFTVDGPIAPHLQPLHRGEQRIRLCLKPPMV